MFMVLWLAGDCCTVCVSVTIHCEYGSHAGELVLWGDSGEERERVGDSGEEKGERRREWGRKEREWGIVGKKEERELDSGEERERVWKKGGEWGYCACRTV